MAYLCLSTEEASGRHCGVGEPPLVDELPHLCKSSWRVRVGVVSGRTGP